jgi:uncharacterized protein with FMN-binding domain
VSLPRLAKPFMTAVAATTLLTTAACGSDSAEDSSADASETTEPAESGDSEGTDAASGDYAEGTYDASGSYSNPGGTSSVAVEMTLAAGGEVTDVTVTPEASGTSEQFQNQFAGGIAEEVVGTNIDELDVGKVAGSSLTAGGFNEALEQIKADAAA